MEEWFNGLSEDGVFLKTEFSDVIITENHDLGFVHCAVTFAAYNEKEERLRQITNRFTFCLKREEGSWVITHEHSSLPIDHETGKGLFKLR